jgi:phosphopantetheine--protein transferase-like protein
LPHIGNDVVDLKEQANADKSGDSRYLKKILTDAEIEFVKNAGNNDAALWSLWACKEAAYKVIKKSFPDAAFIPRRWQVTFIKTQSEYLEGEVIIPKKGSVSVRLFSNPDYVYCVGVDSLAVLNKFIFAVERLPERETNPSFFLRHCIVQHLAKHISLNFQQIKIKRIRQNDELQPPRVYIDGRITDIDISLSHDGRFVAYAFYESR